MFPQFSLHSPLGGAIYYLTQEVIFNAFQESPGLPTAHCATFPADVWVVKVPQQDEGFQS